jgi:hypothetical protein
VDCRDANGDVQLTMSMNGEQVLSAQGSDGDGGLLGPGPVGLHAFAFVTRPVRRPTFGSATSKRSGCRDRDAFVVLMVEAVG